MGVVSWPAVGTVVGESPGFDTVGEFTGLAAEAVSGTCANIPVDDVWDVVDAPRSTVGIVVGEGAGFDALDDPHIVLTVDAESTEAAFELADKTDWFAGVRSSLQLSKEDIVAERDVGLFMSPSLKSSCDLSLPMPWT